MSHFVDTALFYYTLSMLLISILAAATCLSAFLVSRKQSFRFAFAGFLCYFADVALVFKDDFVLDKQALQQTSFYFIGNPLLSVLTGAGLLVSLWLFITTYLGETSRVLRYAPGVIFVAVSAGVLLAFPPGKWEVFTFYTLRELALFWMLIMAGAYFLRLDDEIGRIRLWRYRFWYLWAWVLGIGIVAENIWVLLVLPHDALHGGYLVIFPERNLMENALMVCCAFFAFRSAARTLSLRYLEPPTHDSDPVQTFIDDNIANYSRIHELSERESEVLRLLLLGKDNRSIAKEIYLAVPTVKVHVHNILQKTERKDRRALIRHFWRTA